MAAMYLLCVVVWYLQIEKLASTVVGTTRTYKHICFLGVHRFIRRQNICNTHSFLKHLICCLLMLNGFFFIR